MIEESKFYDSNKAVEMFTYKQDSIQLKRCYFDDTTINYYVGKDFFQGNATVTATNQITIANCDFENHNNPRAFQVSNMCGSDWFSSIILSNIMIQDSDNNKNDETTALFGIDGSNFNQQIQPDLASVILLLVAENDTVNNKDEFSLTNITSLNNNGLCLY